MQPSARIALATLLLGAATYLHGLGSLHIMSNGDEMIYAQITRATAANGHWLPLRSEMPDMVNTKPPLLFWQGIVTTDWARHWTLVALRWPSVAWTLLTATLTGLIAWRAKGRDAAAGLFAAAIYMAFLSTYRYGRPFLTNPPETFWTTLCFFVMLWWRPRSFSSRFLVPSILGVVVGIVLLTKSFAQLLPIGLVLTAWHLHEARCDDGSPRWATLLTRSLPGLAWTALIALGMFSLWFMLDPEPAAIWREFVVHENLGKMKAGRPNYLLAMLWGRMNIWGYGLTWFLNAGVLALPLLGTFILAWQHRRDAGREERLLWIAVAVWFVVFLVPTQRSGRYLLPVMPMLAILTAIHWRQLLPSALTGSLAIAGVVLGGLAWVSVALVREVGGGVLPAAHWPILAGGLGIVALGLFDPRRRGAASVAGALAVSLAVSSCLQAFDPPAGAYAPEVAARAAGRVVWVPRTFRASEEHQRMVLPGADVRGFSSDAEGPAAGDLQTVMQPLRAPPPARAIGSRLDLNGRWAEADFARVFTGGIAEVVFRREWLVVVDE